MDASDFPNCPVDELASECAGVGVFGLSLAEAKCKEIVARAEASATPCSMIDTRKETTTTMSVGHIPYMPQ